MTPERNAGFGYDLHATFAKTRHSELLAEARAERTAHPVDAAAEPRAGLRRGIGHLLVRVGLALADEPPGAHAHSA